MYKKQITKLKTRSRIPKTAGIAAAVAALGIGALAGTHLTSRLIAQYDEAKNAHGHSDQAVEAAVTQSREIIENEQIPFERIVEEDGSIPQTESYTKITGVDGVVARKYRITVVDDQETSRELLDEQIIQQPTHEVVVFGTLPN